LSGCGDRLVVSNALREKVQHSLSGLMVGIESCPSRYSWPRRRNC
jgi:hypothetical protein